MMELVNGTLEESTVLADLEEWNSIARLSLIVLLSDEFNKRISAEKIRSFALVGDILKFME
jgi:acyl carrier protein